MMLMMMNNLDPQVAQYPEELVTYGGNGQVHTSSASMGFTSLRRFIQISLQLAFFKTKKK
jgi:urocanate hydratase